LWSGHVEKYKHDLSMLGVENRAEVGHRKYWEERYERLNEKGAKNGRLF